MNISKMRFLLTLTACLFASVVLLAQDKQQKPSDNQFEFNTSSVQLNVDDSSQVTIRLLDKAGKPVKQPFLVYARGNQASRSLTVRPRSSDSSGTLKTTLIAHRPGTFNLTVRTVGNRENRIEMAIPVEIAFPPLQKIDLSGVPERLFTGTTISLAARVFDAKNFLRDDAEVAFSSSDDDVASFDAFGNLTAHQAGKVTITATAGQIRNSVALDVAKNPVVNVALQSNVEQARTGDVIHFQATAFNKLGQPEQDAPIQLSFVARPDDDRGAPASGQIEPDGRFVADTPGLYTIVATSGPNAARATVRIVPRNVQQDIEVVGHGLVPDVFTSDLWVWQGVDGRDYAVTGTWVARGEAFFWDVTDPTNIQLIDTVTVDARTVNDVKVSEDGRICVITREGASNRRNGIVILDVSNPRDVKVLSAYDDELTGGVHNAFIYENHVYAVNNGQRYDIINIEDPAKPYRVGRFELDTPGHSIHDVWIEDGIAYSSNWDDGVQLVDIGGATSGAPFRKFGEAVNPEFGSVLAGSGSPSNPVKMTSYTYPSGWNHAAFPFKSQSANKFYVVAGDEAFPYGDNTFDYAPTIAAGWLHFVDFTDLNNPREVARFEPPLTGSHNFWVEDDILYAAFYNGGLRVVDVSGELMGDLYRQGREIAWFMPSSRESLIPNVPMVWGPQPYKGLIYFSDFHSGLWAVRLVPKGQKSSE